MEEVFIKLAKKNKDPSSVIALKCMVEDFCFNGQFEQAKSLLEKVEGIFDINYDQVLYSNIAKSVYFLNN